MTASKLRTLRPWLVMLAVFAGVVGLILWLHSTYTRAAPPGGWPALGQTPDGPQGPWVSVTVAPVVRGDLPLYFQALGTVTAYNTINVRPRVSGQLLSVSFREGQEVKAGEVLAVIDPRPYQAVLDQAQGALQQSQAQLDNARIDLRRYRGLYAEDSIAKQTLDTQEALVRQYEGQVRSNQGQLSDARLNLEFTQIRAPISGRLGLRQVDAGNLLNSADSTPLVVITQVKPISVLFSLPQQQLATIARELQAGREIEVEALDRNQNQLLSRGVLQTLDNQIDVSTGTAKLKATFANEDQLLFPNQFVNVRLRAETLPQVLSVPVDAVQYGTDGAYVYKVLKGDLAQRQKITLGTREGERLVVTEGLQADERVVVQGTDRLRDGSQLKIAEAASAEAQDQGERH